MISCFESLAEVTVREIVRNRDVPTDHAVSNM